MVSLREWLSDPVVRQVVAVLLIFIVAAFARAAVNRAIVARVPQLARRPLDLIGKYGIGLIALLLIFGRFYDLSGVWGAVSTILAMVGVGFVAMWSVLSNTMCTFVLILSRPFRIGDHVELVGDAASGTVVDLTFIYTTLRAEDGSLLRIPNNLFFQKIMRCREGRSQIELEEQLKRTELAG
jgi:small-conductance mechanosensitive channel